jgi:small GTP-binding protein
LDFETQVGNAMSFLKMVRKMKKLSEQIKILVVGLDNAGKTTLLASYLQLDASHLPPTFGYRVYTADILGHSVTFLDIGGQRDFKKYWNLYFEDLDGVVLVVDPTDPRDFSEYLLSALSLDLTMAVFINKTDLLSGNSSHLDNTDDRYKIFRTSGADGTGFQEGFGWIVEKIVEKKI